MPTSTKPRKNTPARPPVDALFENAPQSARDALAMHKSERRRSDRQAFADRNGIRPDIAT
jgi:hypothetical protein